MSGKKQLNDRAIQNSSEDKFNTEERIVDPIYAIIQKNEINPCTIVLAGEWGSGKTSALNLLRNKLKKDGSNLIINFEPLIEGKFDTLELMQYFLLKLSNLLPKNRAIIKTIMKSLLLASRCKMSAGVGIFNAEYDLGKNLEAIMDEWSKEQPKFISEEVSKLNVKLREKKLCVIIDEIDRLPSLSILNFLMFARLLEIFDNLICIIAIDYKQVIAKFINEESLGYCDYSSASAYLDKLFQIRFDVANTLNLYNMVAFAKQQLELKCYEGFIFLLDQEIKKDITSTCFWEEIIGYLSTPRLINKWVMNIYTRLKIFEQLDNKLYWLGFVAVCTKYPIILDNMIQHCIGIYASFKLDLNSEISQKYGIKLNGDKEQDIWLALLGISAGQKTGDKPGKIKELLNKVTLHPIEDKATVNLLSEFFRHIENQKYMLVLFLEGYVSDDEVANVQQFFRGDVNKPIKYLIESEGRYSSLLATDIAKSLQYYDKSLRNKPSIKIENINNLWNAANLEQIFFSPYEFIILFLLKQISVKDVINKCDPVPL